MITKKDYRKFCVLRGWRTIWNIADKYLKQDEYTCNWSGEDFIPLSNKSKVIYKSYKNSITLEDSKLFAIMDCFNRPITEYSTLQYDISIRVKNHFLVEYNKFNDLKLWDNLISQ